MTNLFDKTDVFTIVTAEQVKVGDKGYFGNSWLDLQNAIKNNYLASISTIFTGRCDCFMNNAESTIYGLFLPEDKVKNKVKESMYRPFYSIDELFDFFFPDFNKDNVYDSNGNKIKVDTNKKAEYLIGRKITLKQKDDDRIKVMVIQCIAFYDKKDISDIFLNYSLLENIFRNYEIKKDGEFVPFGIKK